MALPKIDTTNIKAPRPVYAVVGAGDLVVEKLREVRHHEFDPRRDVKDVSAQVLTTANSVYSGLATRGEGLVTRVRTQQATADAQGQAERTVSQAKGAATTARKGAKSTTTRAKATGTSARKTAGKTGTATKKAAEKTGN